MRNRISIAVCISFVCLSSIAIRASGQSPITTNGSLSTILKADGSVNPNATGSFDPTGYRLTHGPNGEPRFVSESQSHGGCTPDSWDTSFTTNGVDNDVNVIVS